MSINHNHGFTDSDFDRKLQEIHDILKQSEDCHEKNDNRVQSLHAKIDILQDKVDTMEQKEEKNQTENLKLEKKVEYMNAFITWLFQVYSVRPR